MNPDDPRARQRPSTQPLPPIRTLRGEVERRSAPLAVWIPPVRSGLVAEPAGRERPVETAVLPMPDLELRPEPLPPPGPGRIGGWQPLGAVAEPMELEADLILEDEAGWIEEPEAIVETFALEEIVAPVEGLTPVGDMAGDFERAGPVIDALDVEAEPWVESEFVEFVEEEVGFDPEPSEPIADDGAEGPDPGELANRLERLADQLRMHGRDALISAETGGDPVEAALAAALAGLLRSRED